MTTDSSTNLHFHGVALKPADCRRARASMHMADRITDAIIALADSAGRLYESFVAAPARAIVKRA